MHALRAFQCYEEQNRPHADILPYGSDKGTTGRHDRKNLQLLEL